MTALYEMKQKGRALRKHLQAAFGQEVTLSAAYEALAAMEGSVDWNELSAQLVKSSQTVGAAQVLGSTACPSLVLDVNLGHEQHLPLLARICDSIWDSCVSRWNARPKHYDFDIESDDITIALADYNVVSTGEDGFCDQAEKTVRNALEAWGYLARACELSEGKATLDEPFKPEEVEALMAGKTPPRLSVDTLKVMEVYMPDIVGDYDVPESVPEWQWVEEHHSFAHRKNGVEGGVWEFLVNVECHHDKPDMPDSLRIAMKQAKLSGAAWVMFYQG